MAIRSVATTNTLETFRTTFNSLSTTDIGDPATLTTTSTNLVGAINEVSASTYSGFSIVDSGSSTTQAIQGGDVITFAGDLLLLQAAISRGILFSHILKHLSIGPKSVSIEINIPVSNLSIIIYIKRMACDRAILPTPALRDILTH